MKIYIAHSKNLDYENELYKPVRQYLKEFNILLPHEEGKNDYQSREFYKEITIFLAEVSLPATGVGIELGYADDDKTPIYCIYKKGYKYSRSLTSITSNFYEYSNEKELVNIIKEIINKHKGKN